MKMRTLAIRHLFARPKQSVLTLLGIFFGGLSFVVISGFFLGFREFLTDQLVNNDAQIRISARDDAMDAKQMKSELFSHDENSIWSFSPSGRKTKAAIDNAPSWFELLKKDPRVKAFSPQLSSPVLLSKAGLNSTATLVGTNPSQQVLVSNIEDYMIEGQFSNLQGGGSRIVLGRGLAEKLGARLGETIFLSASGQSALPYKVVGVFATGMKLIDDVRSFAHIKDVQLITQSPNLVNSIAVRLFNYELAASMATSWAEFSIDRVESWDQINASTLSVFKIQDMTRYLVIAVILIVAGFGIYNILTIVVTQKRKDIAILRSMGFDQHDIVSLFLWQGFLLGVIGSSLGVFIGHFINEFLTTIRFGGGPMGGAGFLRISFNPINYALGFALPTLVSCLATFLPARAASRLTPIGIIREGTE